MVDAAQRQTKASRTAAGLGLEGRHRSLANKNEEGIAQFFLLPLTFAAAPHNTHAPRTSQRRRLTHRIDQSIDWRARVVAAPAVSINASSAFASV